MAGVTTKGTGIAISADGLTGHSRAIYEERERIYPTNKTCAYEFSVIYFKYNYFSARA